MNKKLLWTTAALLTTALGIPLSSNAEQTKEVNPLREQATSPHGSMAQPTNVVKVGEYQSLTENQADTVIARIQPHQLAGHAAATLYVRNIPILTFLSTNPVTTSSTIGTNKNSRSATRSAQTKVATIGNLADLNRPTSVGHDHDIQATNTPLWRATAVAAKLNQLSLDNVDASTITVSWKAGDGAATKPLGDAPKETLRDRYLIKVNGEELVEINAETRLPDKTNDLEQDALQATNRLRRLLGNAPPLPEVFGKPAPPPKQQQMRHPKLPQQISLGPIRIRLSGMASWYGPGFHGNRSASGERYNQNALTAAHRSLPFGTKVRVTNIRNGRSVVVRINDRGPYARGRIIDLSAAAARMVGVMQSGIAPVRVEVLGQRPVTAR
jgi:rare lipoprotein A